MNRIMNCKPLFLLMVFYALAGCGYKGDLVLPEQAPTNEPADAPAESQPPATEEEQ